MTLVVLSCSVWLGGGGYAHTHSTLHQKTRFYLTFSAPTSPNSIIQKKTAIFTLGVQRRNKKKQRYAKEANG